MVPQNRIWSGDAQPGLHLIKGGTPTAQPLCHAGGGGFRAQSSSWERVQILSPCS